MLTGTNAGARVGERGGPAPGERSRPGRGRVSARRPVARRRARTGAALLATLPLTLAAAQAPAGALGPLPASAAAYRQDLALLAVHVSDAAALRAEQVAAAADELERARWGFTLALEAAPEAEYELDLSNGAGEWEAGFGVELELGAALDRDRVLRARAALAAAEGRLRSQRRADLRAGLLALSQERLDRRSLADAEVEAEAAAVALAAAQAGGAPAPELMSLEVEASLAALALEREQIAYRPRAEVLSALGLGGAAEVDPSGLLLGPVPFAVARAPLHQDAAALAVAAERAELALRDLPFEHLREVEVVAAYREGGVLVGAELGLRRGVPTADAQVGWRSGDDAHRLNFGVSATLLFSDGSSRRSTLVEAERELSRQALAAFEASQPAREQEAHALLELAYEELHLLLRSRDAVVAELDGARAAGLDTARLERDARRAEDAAERAWQRYVRALFDYLDAIDAVPSAT